jgi:GNAT superfamily N-acetyltransferase
VRDYGPRDRLQWLRLHAGWGATPTQLVEASLDTEPTETEIVVRLVAEAPAEADVVVSAGGRARVIAAGELNEALPGFGGRSVLRIVVDRDWRRRGIGGELAESLLAAAEGRSRILRVVVLDDDPGSRAFAERLGFRVVEHSVGCALDLDSVPPRRASLAGMTVWSPPDSPREADWRRLHAAFVLCCADTPDLEGVLPPVDFLEALVTVPAAAMVVHLHGEVAGFTLAFPEAGDVNTWRIGLTGVAPHLRRRGIGRAVKLALEEVARAHGARRIATNNLSDNLPIRALNRSLGYQPAVGTWRLERPPSG